MKEKRYRRDQYRCDLDFKDDWSEYVIMQDFTDTLWEFDLWPNDHDIFGEMEDELWNRFHGPHIIKKREEERIKRKEQLLKPLKHFSGLRRIYEFFMARRRDNRS